MNKYQESLNILKEIEKDYTFSKIGTRFHVNCDELQELVDKYQEIQNVYFKNEPMESADLNGEKLQELYNCTNKLLDKATPKKPIRMPFHGMISYRCPNDCKKVIDDRIFCTILEKRTKDNYCYHCGQALDWSEEE